MMWLAATNDAAPEDPDPLRLVAPVRSFAGGGDLDY